MRIKLFTLVVIIQVIPGLEISCMTYKCKKYVEGYQQYVIKNKHSGMVLDGATDHVKIRHWENLHSQLWTLEGSHKPGYYYLHNVNQKVLAVSPISKDVLAWQYLENKNQLWKMKTNGDDTEMQVHNFPGQYLMQINGDAIMNDTKRDDASDRWFLVKPEAVCNCRCPIE